MGKLLKATLLISLVIAFTSCASIVSKSSWPLTVQTTPAGAKVEITDKSGIKVFEGETPMTTLLKSGAGFFASQSYMVKLTLNGYETRSIPVTCTLNGWYLGNIVFGGLIGILIVDPATGAMYRLETKLINETLTPKTSANNGQTLKVLNINDISPEMRAHLVAIK